MRSTCEMLESDWSDARRAASSSAEIENCSIPAWERVASRCGALRTRFHVHIFAYLRDAAQRDATRGLASRCEPAFNPYHSLEFTILSESITSATSPSSYFKTPNIELLPDFSLIYSFFSFYLLICSSLYNIIPFASWLLPSVHYDVQNVKVSARMATTNSTEAKSQLK